MPKTIEKEKSKRGPIDARETYRYTTPELKVTSRPVDAFVAPAKQPSPLSSVLQDLQSAGYFLSQASYQQDKEDAEKGTLLGLKGEPLPVSPSKAMARAYGEVRGKADFGAHEVALSEYFEQNKNLPPEEFFAGLHQLGQKAIEGRDDNYLLGFLPGALSAENKIKEKYIQYTRKVVIDDYVTNLKQAVRVDLEGKLDDQGIRDLLSNYQEKSASFGLSKSDVTGLFIETVGERAVREGRPELLNFIDKPDKSGIRVTDTPFGPKAIDYLKKAENAKQANLRESELIAKKAQEATMDAMANKFTTAIATLDPSSPDFITKATDIQKQLITIGESNFSEGRYSTLMKWIDDIIEQGRFRQYSDPEAYSFANKLAENGQFSGDAQAYLGPKLSRSDLTRLMDKSENAIKEQGNRQYTRYTEMRRKYEDLVADRIGAPMTIVEGMMAGKIPGEAQKVLQRRMEAVTLYNSMIEDIEENARKEGRYPTTEEVVNAANKTIKALNEVSNEVATIEPKSQTGTSKAPVSVIDRLRKLKESTSGPEAKVKVGADVYDISSYATDPNHEKNVQKIVQQIPNTTSPEEIDMYVQSVAPGSPVTGEMVVKAAKKYNVQPGALLAIMQQDSHFGTKGKGARTFNPGNVGNDDAGNEVNYGSWEAGVEAVAKWLSKRRSIT